MSKFEFACSFFGYDRVIKNLVSKDKIDMMFDEWKFSLMSFNDWKNHMRISNK